jgi:hypothetical protein
MGLLLFLAVLTISRSASQLTAPSIRNVIVDENAHLGTSSWEIPSGKGASIQIQAYAGATSLMPGQRLTFYVSTQKEGTRYSIEIYRLGWYGGHGGRLMTSQANQVGHAQGYYDTHTHLLVHCSSCSVDTKSGLVECNWQPSYTLTVPSAWITGVYLAKFTDANGLQTYVPFDVRGNFQSSYVAVTPDTTYAAYNDWGGYNLYYNLYRIHKIAYGNLSHLERGVKVSFDRPYSAYYGSSQVLVYEVDAIHWLERQGYDLSYISNVDLHENPTQLLTHHAYLSLGHDEYWTKEMRDGVEYARDNGIGSAFLGANASYWQIRFESGSSGASNRTIVCYKVLTKHHDLARDPLYEKDNSRVTSQWRDPVLNRPENSLIGIMFSNFTNKQFNFPWWVSTLAKSKLLDGTGLKPGQRYGCALVGYEWDRIFANGATPPGLQLLGTSPTISEYNEHDISNTTYYIAPSGAMVFATGSVSWTAALDSYRYDTNQLCADQNPVVPGMQKLMMRVMNGLIVHHAYGGSHPRQISQAAEMVMPPSQLSQLTDAVAAPSLYLFNPPPKPGELKAMKRGSLMVGHGTSFTLISTCTATIKHCLCV